MYYSKLPVRLYSNRGTCLLTGAGAKKHDNVVCGFEFFLHRSVNVTVSYCSNWIITKIV